MKATNATIVRWAGMVVAACLAIGCASGPSPLVKLQEARVTLERARASETADETAIREAESALDYAEEEYRISPRHPLSHVRAEKALIKARAALGTTVSSHTLVETAQ